MEHALNIFKRGDSRSQPGRWGWGVGSLCFRSVQSGVKQGPVSARRFRFLHLSDGLLQVRLLDRTN